MIERISAATSSCIPSLRNQSTNHLEAGEHINGKKNTLKHLPIDFTVPLVAERKMAGRHREGRRRRPELPPRGGGFRRPRPLLGAGVAGRAHRAGLRRDHRALAGGSSSSGVEGGGEGEEPGSDGGGGLLRWLGMA